MKYSITNGVLRIDDDDNGLHVEVKLYQIFEQLSPEERGQCAEAITWQAIMDEAINRLLGESQSWSSNDRLLNLRVLTEVERRFLRFDYSVLYNLLQLSKDMATHEHIYWKLVNDTEWGRRWLSENGIESNYTSDLPDHKALVRLVNEKLDAMRAELPKPENDADLPQAN